MTEEIIMFNKSDVESIEEAIKRLEQERDELKFENDRYKQLLKGCPTEDEDCGLCMIDEQNKRLKQENKELKEFKKEVLKPVCLPNVEEEVTNKYRSALEEIREINKLFFERKYGYPEDLIKIDNIINEVLNG